MGHLLKVNFGKSWLAFLLAGFIFRLWPSALVVAQAQISDPLIKNIEYRALSGAQTALTVALISSAWQTPNDYLYIFNANQSMNPALNWRDNLNFDDAYWVFDSRGNPTASLDGSANLVIRFQRSDSALIADFYDDQSGDGVVSYNLDGDKFNLTEKANGQTNWTLRLIALDGWWERNSRANFNLDIFVDGAVKVLPDEMSKTDARTDGKLDYHLQIRADATGRADSDLRQVVSLQKPPLLNTVLFKNHGARDIALEKALFWPYLSQNSQGTLTRGWNSFPAPLVVNWPTSKITIVAEFVASQVANSRTTNITQALPLLTTTPANQHIRLDDLYDLANIRDDYPDVLTRAQSPPPGDNATLATSLRYSWDSQHDHKWDFKLGLAADRQPLPAHDQMPNWAVNQQWATATLVEAVNGVANSAGLAEWDINRLPSAADAVLTAGLPPDYRGEFAASYNRAPILYISPVDRRLHLKSANYGLWVVGSSEWLETYSDDGQYANQWLYFKDGRLVQSLVYSQGWLFYADDKRLQFKAVPDFKLTSTELLPPTNPASWRDFNRLYNQYSTGATAKPALATWFAQFAGEVRTLPIIGAVAVYTQANRVYFKFDLGALPANLNFLLPNNVNFKPGAFVLEAVAPNPILQYYQPFKLEVNGFTVETDAQREIGAKVLAPESLEPSQWVTLGLRLQTQGFALSERYKLELLVRSDNQPPLVVANQSLELSGIEAGRWFNFRWATPSAANYNFTVRITPQSRRPLSGYFSSLQSPSSEVIAPILNSPVVKTIKVIATPAANQALQPANSDYQWLLLTVLLFLFTIVLLIFVLSRQE